MEWSITFWVFWFPRRWPLMLNIEWFFLNLARNRMVDEKGREEGNKSLKGRQALGQRSWPWSGLFARSAWSQERLQSGPHKTQSLPARRARVLCDQQFHVKCLIWFSNSLSRLTCLVDNILTWYSSGKLWKLRAVWIPIRHKKTGLPKTLQIVSRPTPNSFLLYHTVHV